MRRSLEKRSLETSEGVMRGPFLTESGQWNGGNYLAFVCDGFRCAE